MTLSDWHKKAREEQWAMPHFNFSSLAQLNGILDGLRETKAPALLGTSEGEREFLSLSFAVALVRTAREKEGLPVFLNADHTKSVAAAKQAIDAGYDSVHIDLSIKPLEGNRNGTREVVSYAKAKNPAVEVEGELGYFATESSKIYEEAVAIPEESYTQPEQAITYVKETGVARFAPAIGNLHGIAANKPQIRFALVGALREALPKELTFVLHGGSGIADEDIKKLVRVGFANMHVSTELRVAYTEGLRKTLAEKPEEVAPYHYLDEAREAVAEVVKKKLELFGAIGRAES